MEPLEVGTVFVTTNSETGRLVWLKIETLPSPAGWVDYVWALDPTWESWIEAMAQQSTIEIWWGRKVDPDASRDAAPERVAAP